MLQVLAISLKIGSSEILHGISFDLYPGEFVGLLGPSGCGKSSIVRILLNMLEPTGGSIRFGGKNEKNSPSENRPKLGYVPQDDIVPRSLTIEQAFRYAALLRADPDDPRDRIWKAVTATMESLELSARATTRIRNLSGGERKRVNLGIELLSNPDMLLLDEPTAGLDPHLDLQMLKLLKGLATGQRSVLVTTHILANVALFDTLLFIAQGRLVFAGSPLGALTFFGVSDHDQIYTRVRHISPAVLAERFRSSAFLAEYQSRPRAKASAGNGFKTTDPATGGPRKIPVAAKTVAVSGSPTSPVADHSTNRVEPAKSEDLDAELQKLKERLNSARKGQGTGG
jgi:ABC transport system ATP-binding/permease protein